MKPDPLKRFVRSAAILTAALCASCASLKTPYPDKSYFAIDPGAPAIATTAPTTAPAILVRRLSVARPYDEPAFIYKTGPAKFESDYYDAFITDPASLLTDGMLKWLSAAQPSGSIVPVGSGARHDLALEGNITALYADLQNKTAPMAVIEARFMLIDSSKLDSIIFDKTFSVSAPADNTSAPALAAAWGKAYGQVLHLLNDSLSSILMSSAGDPKK